MYNYPVYTLPGCFLILQVKIIQLRKPTIRLGANIYLDDVKKETIMYRINVVTKHYVVRGMNSMLS